MVQWREYFDSDDCDYGYRRGARELFLDDFVADPEVFRSMLYCCRRMNNFPAAMRTLEMMRYKCGGRVDVYLYTMQELKPVLEDLGIPSVEDMNLHLTPTEF